MKKTWLVAGGLLLLGACSDNTARVWRSNNRPPVAPDNAGQETSDQSVNRGDASTWSFKPVQSGN